jgi:hypothetical protein
MTHDAELPQQDPEVVIALIRDAVQPLLDDDILTPFEMGAGLTALSAEILFELPPEDFLDLFNIQLHFIEPATQVAESMMQAQSGTVAVN